MLKTEGESTSSTPKGGGWLAPGLGGEGGVNFSFLLGREKMGGESLQVAEAGEAIIKGDVGGKRPRRNDRDGFPQQEGRVRSSNLCLKLDSIVPDEMQCVLLNECGERAMHCEV